MFLNILEGTVENKQKIRKNCFGNEVLDLWKSYLNCPQNYLEKIVPEIWTFYGVNLGLYALSDAFYTCSRHPQV